MLLQANHWSGVFGRWSLLGARALKDVRSRKGVKKRPTLEREKLYHVVLDLRKEGLSYNQIIRKIEAEHGEKLRKSHLSDWINGKHEPFGSVRTFTADPRPELAYVIGVKMGDASMSVNRAYSYMIKLRVIDREFAEEFAKCLSVVLGRDPPRVKWHEKTHAWHTQLSSMLLQKFLREALPPLKKVIEHCNDCVSAFLRGFFDSEGSVYRTQLRVANTNRTMLLYVRHLLESRFGIEVGGPYLSSTGGRLVIIKGKQYRANKDCFVLAVATSSIPAYQSSVGFTIIRKAKRLALAAETLI
jgi:intein-encoded DNA endonuclease-like protein